MVKLNYVDSRNIYGTMNGGTIRLSNITKADKEMLIKQHALQTLEGYELTQEDKDRIFDTHWENFARDNGFDPGRKFMTLQDTKKRELGSYFELEKEYVEANPGGWTDIFESILIVTDKVPGVVACHPVADCPVVIMHDKKQNIAALAHCSADLVDKKLPMMVADALTQGYGTKEEDISILVGAHAGPNWTYNNYPKWATDEELWNDCITEKDGLYKINLKKALLKQFVERKLGNCPTKMSLADTITDPRYYSNSAKDYDSSKLGRHIEGIFFEDDSKTMGKRR